MKILDTHKAMAITKFLRNGVISRSFEHMDRLNRAESELEILKAGYYDEAISAENGILQNENKVLRIGVRILESRNSGLRFRMKRNRKKCRIGCRSLHL